MPPIYRQSTTSKRLISVSKSRKLKSISAQSKNRLARSKTKRYYLITTKSKTCWPIHFTSSILALASFSLITIQAYTFLKNNDHILWAPAALPPSTPTTWWSRADETTLSLWRTSWSTSRRVNSPGSDKSTILTWTNAKSMTSSPSASSIPTLKISPAIYLKSCKSSTCTAEKELISMNDQIMIY